MNAFKTIIPLILALSMLCGDNGRAVFGSLMLSLNETKQISTADHAKDIELETVVYNQLAGSIYSVTGCGPTSAAMLLTSEKDFELSKDQSVIDAYKNGYYYFAGYNFTSGRGVTQENIQSLIRYYGFDSTIDHLWNNSDEEIINKLNEQLSAGHRVIIGYYSDHGFLHYSLIYARTYSDGTYSYNVADPWGGVVLTWTQQMLCQVINRVYGNDAYSFEGLVKGFQWLT